MKFFKYIHNIYKKYIPQSLRWIIRCIFNLIIYFPHHVLFIITYLFNRRKEFSYNLALMTMIKNEAPYLKEWIEYNKIIGVDKFIFYDNESNDNTKEILQPYIESGIVDYLYFPGYKMQKKAFNHAIKKYRYKVKYLGLIDIDEYIVPLKHDNIPQLIDEVISLRKKIFVGLVLYWVNFGYNGHLTKPDGLIIENYKKSSGTTNHHKCIVNPRFVLKYDVHNGYYYFNFTASDEYGNNFYNEMDPKIKTIDKVKINHYLTKSYEERKIKFLKGGAARGKIFGQIPEYDPYYLSNVVDNSIDRFIPILKARMKQE